MKVQKEMKVTIFMAATVSSFLTVFSPINQPTTWTSQSAGQLSAQCVTDVIVFYMIITATNLSA